MVREHAHVVHRYARVYLDPEDAEEVAAEVFAVAWRRGDEAPDHPRAWLLGVARRVVANHVRGRRRRLALLDRVGRAREPARAEQTALLEELDALRAALARLRPADRQVIALLGAEELTTGEIARVLGISPDAAAARVSRARRRLRAVYQPDHEGNGHE
ncbi:RNA polymerase sigma factor [Myceligenerans pegani]|uniref:RNA polymerase sigma factor n=1 Tax=Myceligenerans pegani TaxID=2776917 RepID=UPI001CEFC29A|nr:sigma-70 family RNA polymerase sigma factor [Myceligenerans sp. TRM 65318]